VFSDHNRSLMSRLRKLHTRVQAYTQPPAKLTHPLEITSLQKTDDGLLFVETACECATKMNAKSSSTGVLQAQATDCPCAGASATRVSHPVIIKPTNLNIIDQPLFQQQHAAINHLLKGNNIIITQAVLDQGAVTASEAGALHERLVDYADQHRNVPLVPPNILVEAAATVDVAVDMDADAEMDAEMDIDAAADAELATTPTIAWVDREDNQRTPLPDVPPPEVTIVIPAKCEGVGCPFVAGPTPPGVDPIKHHRRQRVLYEKRLLAEELKKQDEAEDLKRELEAGPDYYNAKVQVEREFVDEDNQRRRQEKELVWQTIRKKRGT